MIRLKNLWYHLVMWYYHWRYPTVRERGLTRADAKQCVSKGWSDLVDRVYDICEVHNIVVSDVKQKYAQLRVYWWWPTTIDYEEAACDKIIQALIALENISQTICEECGQAGKPVTVHGWWYTLCNVCKEKMEINHV